MRLTVPQKEIKQATAHYVIARWGRRTGKDTVVKAMLKPEDIIVYPYLMKQHYEQMFDRSNLISDSAFRSEALRGRKLGRVFIMEAASTRRLYRTLDIIDELDVFSQVYLISTPRIQPPITSSGFLFDAICARLEITPLDNYYYSQQGQGHNPFISEEAIKQLEEHTPEYFEEEIQGEFSDGQTRTKK